MKLCVTQDKRTTTSNPEALEGLCTYGVVSPFSERTSDGLYLLNVSGLWVWSGSKRKEEAHNNVQ